MSLRASLLLILPVLLAACGFEPMYGQRSAANNPALYAGVKIDPISGRDGQLLRQGLEDMLNPGGAAPQNPAYRLEVSLRKSSGAIGVARDGTVSRYNLYLDSHYTLYRTSDNLAVATGDCRRVSSYNNLTGAYFSTFVSENDALKQGVRELAEDYSQRLSTYLTSADAGKPLAEQPKPRDPNAPPEPELPKLPDLPALNNVSTF